MWLHLQIFLVFPHKQPLASLCQTRPKKFHFLTHIPITPSGIQQLHCATPHPASQPRQPPILQAWLTVHIFTHSRLPQLYLPTRCTTLSLSLWSASFFSALSLHPFLRGCLFFCTALSSAQLLILPILLRRNAYMSKKLPVSLPSASVPSSYCHLLDLGLLYRSRSSTAESISSHLSRARNVF